MTAIVVLLVVLVFSWPTPETIHEEPLGWVTRAAYALVYGFIIDVGSAYPAQQLSSARPEVCTVPEEAPTLLAYWKAWDCKHAAEDKLATTGSNHGMIAGAIACVLFFVALSTYQSYWGRYQAKPVSGAKPGGSQTGKGARDDCRGPSHDSPPGPEPADREVPSMAPGSVPPSI
ncbi:hypothetical protein [Microlunatus antarcticus]|uniref:Uncharacterized protein n=1 Tax=Microlunatus antarcticus TaxID=53388 RepID=A0A7W5P6G9_9ACTN|nr:hypothetical protein [Microlunatus antarcticus]MBB3326362.1 hypothetical protein [Microlunatus antarcticus]